MRARQRAHLGPGLLEGESTRCAGVDCSSRPNTVVRPPSRVLQPGMVVTVEPGIYVRPADDVPQKYWGIGIRIEDDAVITSDGCELISRGAPVEVADIEALMRA